MLYLHLAVFAFVALAPVGSIAWQLIARNKEDLKTSQQEYQHLLASTISREMDIRMAALRSQLERCARSLALAATPDRAARDEAVRRVLDAAVDDRMRYARFTDARGDIFVSRTFEPPPPALEPALAAGDRLAAESLAGTRDGGTTIATHADPVLLPGGPSRAALVLAAPVTTGGRYLGVVSAVIDLQAVWDAVVADHPGTGHALFAVDAKGRLFAATKLPGVEVGRDMADSEIVRRFSNHTGLATETVPFSWAPRRAAPLERYLGSYELSREGWGVFVQAKEQDIYYTVSKMIERTLLWCLLALLGALAAGWVFAFLLTDPIKRLVEAARALTQGNHSARVRVHSLTEVGELADTFNRMAADIEDQIRRLHLAAAENRQLFVGTAKALVSAIDAKDPYTRGHSDRVNRYSVILARSHGLADPEIEDINVASLLHDVGKIGVDDAILRKPGHLTDPEFAIMKRHPVIGADIMAPIRQMKRMLPGLRSHHERWTGGGYPDSLKGDAIPLMARIIAVADSFDAMTTDRPYQKAMTFDQAHARLNELKGTAFDEHVIESFNRAYRAGQFPPPSRPAAIQPEPASSVA
jgi:HD-GYP domain-containing protein (c-di-GMP phosphodiesterase class II)